MRIKVNPERLKECRDDLKLVDDVIRQIRAQTSSVESNLGRLHELSLNRIRRELGKQNRKLEDTRRKVGNLRTSLDEISRRYKETEQKVYELKGIGFIMPPDAQGNGARGNVPAEEKDKVIRDFERDHAKEVKKLDKFLRSGDSDDLTEDDIRNIKYLIYTAEEPYRSIYLNSVSKYKIDTTDSDGQAFYRPWAHKVTYDYPDCFGEDPRGPYTTFFHEGGHAIDDLSDKSKWLGSDTENFKVHSDAIGHEVTLREAREYDVYYNRENEHSITSIAHKIIDNGSSGSRGNVDRVIEAFKAGDSSGLNKNDLAMYNAVKNEYFKANTGHEEFEAVSDVYGAMSNNALRNGYGHDQPYWSNDETKAGKELWAEYFSYHMAGDGESLDNLLEFFPEASKVLDQYAQSLGG